MKRPMTWPGALLTIAVAAGLGGGTATAKITDVGVAGVEIGMSEDAVHHELGRPSSTRREGAGAKLLVYRRERLDVLLRGDAVIRLRTTSAREKTTNGVGPGTSEGTMKRRLRGERCATARGARVCWVVKAQTVLSFTCRRGRVSQAEVARAES
jgi:hypothetical protein